jgi:protein-arginine kinase activator protein McsA
MQKVNRIRHCAQCGNKALEEDMYLVEGASTSHRYVCYDCAPNISPEQLHSNVTAFGFDKFMDDTLLKEHRTILTEDKETTPQRRYQELYREQYGNRVTVKRSGR